MRLTGDVVGAAHVTVARSCGYPAYLTPSPPRMADPGVHELCIRLVPGTRTLGAIAEDGNCIHLGVLHPGADYYELADQLYEILEAHVPPTDGTVPHDPQVIELFPASRS